MRKERGCWTWVRNGMYATALAAAVPWLCYRGWRRGSFHNGWREKMFGPRTFPHGMLPTRSPDQPLIWLHGVSVGEVQLLKPLMDRLAELLPRGRFAISTSTSTGMELAEKLFAADVCKFYFPLDFSWAVARTLGQLKPDLLVLGELEIWPNLIAACQRQGIPVAVVNGRLSERSYRGYRRLKVVLRSAFSRLSLVCAQNELYAERFVDCGVESQRVCVTGSIKFDNAETNRQAEQVQHLRRLVGLDQHPGPVWILGSSQGPEEQAACQAVVEARRTHPQLKTIVVPRHRQRFEEAAQLLTQQLSSLTPTRKPLKILRRSELVAPVAPEQWDVLLVDTIGELRWWWGVADIALVGGSFGHRGGQNMMEPAAYGASVAFGPRTENFKDIVAMLLADEAAVSLTGLDAIAAWLAEQLAAPEMARQRGLRAQRLIVAQQGAMARTVERLVAQLPRVDIEKVPALLASSARTP